MTTELNALVIAAASISFFHTILGPDHYLLFIMMSWARNLIPIFMCPAAKDSLIGLTVVTCVFGIVTIATMLGVVLLSVAGVNFIRLSRLQRFAHVIAGATICMSLRPGYSVLRVVSTYQEDKNGAS